MNTFIPNQNYRRHNYIDATPPKFKKETWVLDLPVGVEFISPGKKGHLLLNDYSNTALFDIKTQKTIWSVRERESGGYCYIDGDKIYSGSSEFAVFDYETGASNTKGPQNYIHPIYYDGFLTQLGSTAFNLVDPKKKNKRILQTKFLAETRRRHTPVIFDDTLWVVTKTKKESLLNGINLDSGEQKVYGLSDFLEKGLVAYKNNIYYSSEKALIGIDTLTGEECLNLSFENDNPQGFNFAIKDNILYVSGSLAIYRIDLDKNKLLSPFLEATDINQKRFYGLGKMLIIGNCLLALTDSREITYKYIDDKKEKTHKITFDKEKHNIRCFESNLLFHEGAIYLAAYPESGSGSTLIRLG